jgi:HAE1 family hydrophobic/amphiphilic exporter-1
MGYDWADMSFQEKRAPNPLIVFALAIFLVFLVLAAQYESWGLAVQRATGDAVRRLRCVLRIVGGTAVLGELRQQRVRADRTHHAHWARGEERDSDREFAKMLREQGKDPVTAALEGARLRFRPILMTAFAFILGVVPLLIASGAGAEGRKVMGMAVFSGMLIATFLGVFLIPVLFVTVEKVIGRGRALAEETPHIHPPLASGAHP